jgi:hypothetical protein
MLWVQQPINVKFKQPLGAIKILSGIAVQILLHWHATSQQSARPTLFLPIGASQIKLYIQEIFLLERQPRENYCFLLFPKLYIKVTKNKIVCPLLYRLSYQRKIAQSA